MAYQPLALAPGVPMNVERLLRRGVEPLLADVHAMLRLPLRKPRIDAGCNFTIAHVLLAVVAGVSSAFYRRGLLDGQAFVGLLVEFYPWEAEPEKVDPKLYAEMLWKTFRNPFAHSLGLAFETRGKGKNRTRELKPRGYEVKVGRGRPSMKERELIALERSTSRPPVDPTLVAPSHKRVLWVEAFYWGIRTMVYRLTADQQLMAEVSACLEEQISKA